MGGDQAGRTPQPQGTAGGGWRWPSTRESGPFKSDPGACWGDAGATSRLGIGLWEEERAPPGCMSGRPGASVLGLQVHVVWGPARLRPCPEGVPATRPGAPPGPQVPAGQGGPRWTCPAPVGPALALGTHPARTPRPARSRPPPRVRASPDGAGGLCRGPAGVPHMAPGSGAEPQAPSGTSMPTGGGCRDARASTVHWASSSPQPPPPLDQWGREGLTGGSLRSRGKADTAPGSGPWAWRLQRGAAGCAGPEHPAVTATRPRPCGPRAVREQPPWEGLCWGPGAWHE